MPFIDWSDSEELLGLLIEYISDEKNEAFRDKERHRFLSKLLNDLTQAIGQSRNPTHDLTRIYDSIDNEFKEDPAVIHVRDCIEELRRLK
ncbi:MAG TPA: hypothetical protein VLH08_08030 [Acidobacteriota bacterium]|nr:hypothetical protein [Acidobacteriota bacterium]